VLADSRARAAGATLTQLDLEPLPAAERPTTLPMPSPPGDVPKPTPAIDHLVDSIVCAGATAAALSPQQARPILAAAFARAVALGLSMREIAVALARES